MDNPSINRACAYKTFAYCSNCSFAKETGKQCAYRRRQIQTRVLSLYGVSDRQVAQEQPVQPRTHSTVRQVFEVDEFLARRHIRNGVGRRARQRRSRTARFVFHGQSCDAQLSRNGLYNSVSVRLVPSAHRRKSAGGASRYVVAERRSVDDAALG